MQDTILASSTEDDLDAVMEIERLSYATPWVRQAFAEELARPWARLEILREVASGRVVAFCNYWLVVDELQILNIAVHPEARRHGYASCLLRHVLSQAEAEKVRVVSLEVRVSNHAAQALYRKYGFRDVGTRPRYYADNSEDAVLMDLELPQ